MTILIEGMGLFFEIYQKIDKAYRRYFQTKLAEYGFTPNEIVVILFLYNNAPGLDTATDIAIRKGMSKGMIARSVDSLCEKNYLEAVRDKKDRRIVHLALKNEHSQIAEEIERTQKDFFDQLVGDIPRNDLDLVRDTLTKLLTNSEIFLDTRRNHHAE
ncbi:MAG: MarR family winged helix-turn-helix transcriptional regulator [Clostridium sp.]